MVHLALGSLRFHTGGFAASFVATFLGATMLMAFASMLDTSTGARVSAADAETLEAMAIFASGWSVVLVVFAVASTLTLAVRQRGSEMALLTSIGATPSQVRRLIVGEAGVVAALAALAAILPAMLLGRLIFDLLRDSGQVGSAVDYRFGPFAIGMGLGITLLSAAVAAVMAAWRATKARAAQAVLGSAIERPRMSRKRMIAAWIFLALGAGMAAVTATVMRGEGSDAMATAGQASIWASIGLALLAPVLLRAGIAVLAGPLRLLGGASGYLTVHNLRQRTHQMAGALMPIILFTGIATGTLYLQGIEDAATSAAGAVQTNEERTIETLNYVVVGMIATFAAIMLINTLIAATTYRRQEFAQQRLAGSTPPQVLRMVGLESLVLAATGVLLGTIASIFTVVSYGIARTGSILPDAGIAIYAGIVAVAATLTLASSLGAARRAIGAPALEAVAPRLTRPSS